MKIIYSYLKQFLPDLKKTARQVADDLTMLGHFCGGFEEKEGEEIMDLEVRQNRGDCLSYYGLAKDLAVYYQLPLQIEETALPKPEGKQTLPIKVAATKEVKRLMALKIIDLNNSPSPDWLQKFLNLHEINSINTLVDLTNYIMFWYGIPDHAFDTRVTGDELVWEINEQGGKFITLDGTELNLSKENLVISAKGEVNSLSFIGGKNCAIGLETKETIIEMAIYDRVRVRKDYKSLNAVTEAAIRLEKDLDPELIPQAFGHLAKLILEHCGGKIVSDPFDYYPEPISFPRIEFDSKKPSLYAGVEIPEDFAADVLKRLGCQNNGKVIIPPSLRKDLNLEEDLIEEVVRFYGYDKIPTDQPISNKALPDITPKIVYLMERARRLLAELGYDEIRSWPLIQEKYLFKAENLPEGAKPLYAQNTVNSEYPALRQSIVSSLMLQKKQWQKYKVPDLKFFEIGKIFYELNGEYKESYSLGVYNQDAQELEKDARTFLTRLGAAEERRPINNNILEIDLDELLKQLEKVGKLEFQKEESQAVYELIGQIINLDANVTFSEKQDPAKLVEEYRRRIGSEHLWQLEITDLFEDKQKKTCKYTFKAHYFNCDDKAAKRVHLKAFELGS